MSKTAQAYAVKDGDGLALDTVARTKRRAVVIWLALKQEIIIGGEDTDDEVYKIFNEYADEAKVIRVGVIEAIT